MNVRTNQIVYYYKDLILRNQVENKAYFSIHKMNV